MSSRISAAKNLLGCVRMQTDAIGVAFSAGKDSWATMDLCAQLFARVEAFYLYRVRDLEVIRRQCAIVRKRYGVVVRHYPHFDLSRCYQHAVLMPHFAVLDDVPKIEMADVEARFRDEAQVRWIAYGWRRSDPFSRAMILKSTRGLDSKAGRVFPLRVWSRADVLAYLKARRIPTPPSFGRSEQGGVDFHPAVLAELKEKFPDDYARLVEAFPFAPAQEVAHQVRGARGRSKRDPGAAG